ncbi:hypothetical protein [Brenneria salicis]|uniref:Arabinogalactan endo-beta-1,4-galactanase n=1 Tax=Brenneria salicis ATCC 15712 = DSM 30166 TaxID=714314 RepID=A0A366I4A5_9GAMM|nr:hypothetical protein [Brenneria salicis]RBP62863.1 hypothetical protein DES54_11442 [Brenneria salicis ATCC 15712 = DSM 30166]RLM30733.1 hypothetical protein BHG07_09150 [Brenneria salicis ATCC 15712 = DSM 30166]
MRNSLRHAMKYSVLACGLFPLLASGQNKPVNDQLLYGVAYYDEYMPYDRLNEDIRMMKAAGINVVRINCPAQYQSTG